MKSKLLLFILLLSGGVIYAQNDTIKTLIFTEFASGGDVGVYLEITNVGDKAIQMGDFKLAKLSPYVDFQIFDEEVDEWGPNDAYYFLPEGMLEPGESYVITAAVDFGPAQYQKRVPGFESNEREKNPDWYKIADLLIHWKEYKSTEADIDSVTTAIPGSKRWGDIQATLASWRGRSGFYLEQHLPNGDSVVVDQVNCVFDLEGKNQDTPNGVEGYDVAGVSGATGSYAICRKYIVKSGNLKFRDARGVGEDDSEWMVIPKASGNWRDIFWTVGNHGDYNLNENTLESDIIDVDFTNKVITVPWGIRRGDGIMQNMVEKPGIAWEYILNSNVEDSLTFACRTGDQLKVYVCGSDLDKATFDIVVADPTNDANIIVPVANKDVNGWWRRAIQRGSGDYGWPRVSENESGADTISGRWQGSGVKIGIPYATRVDSLVQRLEKPANAKWEFIWVDGVERPDLKEGDKLKITAQNGSSKEYYIQVQEKQTSHNAYLSSITWPDIPEHYKGIYGWIGDTIPNFGSRVYNYRIQIPLDVDGIPALQAKTEDLNAKVDVKRAANLTGTLEDRTITFTVTAEDDSVVNIYNIELIKEKNPANLQPYKADPFFSEYVYADQWANFFTEIVNPGNQPLDLSDYMIVANYTSDPASAITWNSDKASWNNRYVRYVPGYKWVDEANWQINPAMLEQDLNVNAIVMPGDVFCLGSIGNAGQTKHPNFVNDYWWVPDQLDVQFRNSGGFFNPWDEATGGNTAAGNWGGSSFLFKILNDSIKQGLKPANDPNDFELVDAMGMVDGSAWTIGTWKYSVMTCNIIRKPNIYSGEPTMQTSFGTNDDDSEWLHYDRPYWQAKNAGYPQDILYDAADLGKHYMITPTHYMSTISSVVYKVSEGYSTKENIRGIVTGTNAANFLSNIIKANENQSLTVKGLNGVLPGDALLSMNDTLVVMSADRTNTSKYILEVSDQGLSANAVLTSSRYEITITSDPKSAGNENAGSGIVGGFEYGTSLKTILANINVPAGASMNAINGDGAYVPLKMLNFDTTYVNVTVNDNIYLDVIAENGTTEIVYQLVPQASAQDAFVTSDVYVVVQKTFLINYVPRGTSAQILLSNLVTSAGASMKLVNKMGQERIDGNVVQDDKIVVTSPDGMHTKVYYISMLASEYVPETTYLAYILSNVYSVDQVTYVVDGVSGTESISDFLTKVIPAAGSTAMVIDKDGNHKITGDINRDDMVMVTSVDGKMKVFYTFGQLTANKVFESNGIELYPNPTKGQINVSGVKAGYRIQVYNSVGAVIRDINVQNSIETISLGNQPSGIYMVVVRNENKIVGRYKALKN